VNRFSAAYLLPLVLVAAAAYFFTEAGLGWGFACLWGWLAAEQYQTYSAMRRLAQAQKSILNIARMPAIALHVLRLQSPQIRDALEEAAEITENDMELKLSWDEILEEIGRRAEQKSR
jgi:hypothetical protein